MSLLIITPGVQSTIQARSRNGMRHLGIPSGGAADPLSLALANRLVGNQWDAPAIEAALVGQPVEIQIEIVFIKGIQFEHIAGGVAVGQPNCGKSGTLFRATNAVFEPMNARSPISVRCLLAPS